MSLTAAQRFALLAPDYADNVESWLEMANERLAAVETPNWPSTTRLQAQALMAAHLASLSTDSSRAEGTGGAVTLKREGDLSVSFSRTGAGVTDVFLDLRQTKYGLQLIGLFRSSFISLDGLGTPAPCNYAAGGW